MLAARRHRARCRRNDAQVARPHARQPRGARRGACSSRCAGRRSHGLEFAAEAAARGASAVLWEPRARTSQPPAAAAARVRARRSTGLHALVGRIADRFFSWPSSHSRSLSASPAPTARPPAPICSRSAWSASAVAAAYIGTLGWGRIGGARDADPHHARTPSACIARWRSCTSRGVREVAMEVSSHALDQGRVDGVRFHCRGIHQSDARSSRLPRLDAGVWRRPRRACSQRRGPAARDRQRRRRLRPRAGAALCGPRAAHRGLDRRRRRRLARRALAARERGRRSICAGVVDAMSAAASARAACARGCSAASMPRTRWSCSAACSRSACRSTRPRRRSPGARRRRAAWK